MGQKVHKMDRKWDKNAYIVGKCVENVQKMDRKCIYRRKMCKKWTEKGGKMHI